MCICTRKLQRVKTDAKYLHPALKNVYAMNKQLTHNPMYIYLLVLTITVSGGLWEAAFLCCVEQYGCRGAGLCPGPFFVLYPAVSLL